MTQLDLGALEALEALHKKIGTHKLCREWMYSGIRHLQRNCDFETVDGFAEPDRQCGGAMADILNTLPALIARMRELEAENTQAKGLIWYAWHEFNAIRARSGSPLDQYGMTTVSVDYWKTMLDAFAAFIGEDARKPWPSDAAKTALTQQEPQP